MRAFRATAILGVCLWASTFVTPASAIERSTDRMSASSYSVAQALKRIDGTKCGIDSNSLGLLTVPVGVVHSDGVNAVLVGICMNGLGPFPFVVDTGAGVTAFGEALVSHLKLARTGASTKIQAIGCTASASNVDVRDWSLGGRTLAPQDVVSLKFPQAPQLGSIDGVIGSDVLSRFGAIRIDYQTQDLTLLGSEAPAPTAVVLRQKPTTVKTPASLLAGTNPNALGLTLIESPQETTIWTTVDFGGVPFNFVVDSGASISLVSPAPSGPFLLPVSNRFEAASAGCLVEGSEVASGKWNVGPIQLPPQHLGVVALPLLSGLGVLGSDVFFEAHVLVIDYRNARMFLGSGFGSVSGK